jgi:hypothetical protein
MIEVKAYVQVYEINGAPTDGANLIVQSYVIDKRPIKGFIILSIEGTDYLVNADDMELAIKNAANIGS